MTERLLTRRGTAADGQRTAAADEPDRSLMGTARTELLGAGLDDLVTASYAQLPPDSDYEAYRRRRSIMHLVRWLSAFPGPTWQARWVASGLDDGGTPWPDEPDHTRCGLLFKGARALICLGVILPDYPWLLDTSFAWLFSAYRQANDPSGFDKLDEALRELRISDRVARDAVVAATRVCMRTGKKSPSLITSDDLIHFDTVLRNTGRSPRAGHEALWRALHTTGQISGPTSLRAVHMRGQLSTVQLVDRYGLQCQPIRDLIVTYITERSPAMDYTSISNLAFWLGKLFWADLERHHPGIDSLRLDPEVAAAWKKRVAVRVNSKGVEVPRNNRHSVLACVRAFYLDLNQWAYEDPARWAAWAVPCPVRKSDVDARNKHKARVTAKMQARTRTLAEFVPQLVATSRTRRAHARSLADAVRDQPVSTRVVVDGTAYTMVQHGTRRRRRLLVCPEGDGVLFDPVFEEAEAFWAWATIEVMRLSGLRIEEVMELTHLSIRRYTQPDGQVVPLLQVAPSKIDAERVFPISPELAHVFAQIIERVRAEHPTIPLCPRYDTLERTWGPPLPHLFQRPVGGTHQVFSPASVRNWLNRTLERADLRDVDGTPIRFVPHDFRRLFATEVVNTGLPIHIAAAVLGHRTLDTTRGYTAVYPEEIIRHYQTFIHERRTHRPTAEYREPTGAEWAEFEQHFTLRKVAYGNCDRPYGSSCAHEHACVRCPMLRPEPSRLPLLRELEANLTERIAEARQQVWLGEVAGLQETLVALRAKTEHAERLAAAGVTDSPEQLT